MSLPIIVVGAGGRMGKTICGLVQESDAMTLVGMVERKEFQPAAPEGCLVSDDLDAVVAACPKESCIVDFSAPQVSVNSARVAASSR